MGPGRTWKRADFRLKKTFMVSLVLFPFLSSADSSSRRMTGRRIEFFDLNWILDPLVSDVTVKSRDEGPGI